MKRLQPVLNRRQFVTGGMTAPAISRAAAGPGVPPNIVIILADDLGYGDPSCYGHPTIQTPNIDRMAREGMRFTQFYSAASLCTPSRAGLMTGRLPIRSGLTRVLFPWSEGGIQDSEITIADLLKKSGYATMCVGKWHLGHRRRYLPTRHGFDGYFGIPYSNDMSKATQPTASWVDRTPPTPLMRGEEVIEQEPDQRYLTRRYTEEAIRFIRESCSAGRPFFLYLPHTFPHMPLFASERFRGKSLRGLYGDVVEELDWSVGEILAELGRLGVDGSTLVAFTSDNGPATGSAGLLRDQKASTFEGGMRVPFIARWPGRIPAAVTTPAFGATMDLLPTCAKLAGATLPADRTYDGDDLAPVLLGNSTGREPLFFYYSNLDDDQGLKAVRKGRWKLHTSIGSFRKAPLLRDESGPPLLFDLNEDPSEQRNLAGAKPEIVNELQAVMETHKASVRPGPQQL